MAKIRGTTTRAGKTTTRKIPDVAADRIERPHGGKTEKQVGAQTEVERHNLSGASGARSGSVRQVGPSSIRPPAGPTGSVKRAGAANVEDVIAVEGIGGGPPYSRQSGSVRQVGPVSQSFQALVGTGSGGAGTPKSGRVTRSTRTIHDSTLLKSGVGRTHPWSVFAGSPGSFRGNRAVRVAGGAGGSVLVNGRSRRFGTEAEGEMLVEPTGPTIIPGSTGS